MNKILLEEEKEHNLLLKEDSIIVINKNSTLLNIETNNEIKAFILVMDSCVSININARINLILNIFAVNSTINEKINLLNDDIYLDYAYSTINENDNNYTIDINHLGRSIKSKITNHGINTKNNKLSFIINTIVPKDSTNINTNQDSKIIVLNDQTATIKPNLLIDNDDIEANHSAYIGRFKEDELFYLETRGISKKDSLDLLVRSFLIGNMNIGYEEKEIILDTIKMYWR